MIKPHQIIGSLEDPYLYRWKLLPLNRWFNVYLHKFMRSDDDRALHDHPWFNASIVLNNGYFEHYQDGTVKYQKPGSIIFRGAREAHRIELMYGRAGTELPVWTIFIIGPKLRTWGFYCPQGWRRWTEYVEITEAGNEIGKGCD